MDEITTVLCEWGNLFKRFYLTTHEVFQPIRHKILELIGLRSQILSGNLPVDEMKRVKLMATSEIDTGNKLLGKFSLQPSHFRLFIFILYLLFVFMPRKIYNKMLECDPFHWCDN